MASVYPAEDIKHERMVALKILRPELAAVIGAERFLSEIKTTANLQRPHIFALFDSGEAGGYLYYVMPYIDGETLREKGLREDLLYSEFRVRTHERASSQSPAIAAGRVCQTNALARIPPGTATSSARRSITSATSGVTADGLRQCPVSIRNSPLG